MSIESNASKPNETVEQLRSQLQLEAQKRRQAEEALESAQQELNRLELIANHTQHALIVANLDGKIEWTNNAFTEQTGYSAEEALGHRPDDLLQGADTDPATQKLIRKTLARPQSKQQAELLDGSEGIYRDLFETTRDAIMSLGEEGFFNCNEATLKLFGFDSREEFCRNHPLDLSPEFQADGQRSADAVVGVVERAFREGNNQFEWRHCRRDGTEFDAEVILSRYQIESGPVIQASVRDISERKAAEAESWASLKYLDVTIAPEPNEISTCS